MTFLFQTVHIDHEPLLHIALEHALIRLVDALDVDHLHVRDNPVPGAVVEHVLGLLDPADQRTGQAAALEGKGLEDIRGVLGGVAVGLGHFVHLCDLTVEVSGPA